MAQVAPGKSLLFSYDANGQAISVNYNGTEYYYLRNGQNDIVGLMDESGVRVVEYIYDAWGTLISTTGTLATTLGADNPFRYRGYYYDTETGLYYLTTRYYAPEVCRFISADVYMSTGQSVIGGNMWAYCLNNPVVCTDGDGTIALVDDALIILLLLLGTSAIAIVGTIGCNNDTHIGIGIDQLFHPDPVMSALIIMAATGQKHKPASINSVAAKKAQRKLRPIGRRIRKSGKKAAKEAAKKAGRGKEPIHHPKGKYGPHYHPNVEMPTKLTPHAPSPHDHYYGGIIGGLTGGRFVYEKEN